MNDGDIVFVAVVYRRGTTIVCGASSTRERAKKHVDDVLRQVTAWAENESSLIDRDGDCVGRVVEMALT